MFILVIGSPDSGKSIHAEELATALSDGAAKAYIATMIPYGDEGQKRIVKHRKMREGKGFETFEKGRRLEELIPILQKQEISVGLLECISNLVGNELYAEENAGADDTYLLSVMLSEILELKTCFEHLVVVTNAFEEEASFDEETIRYVRLQRRLNDLLKLLVNQFHIKEGEQWVIYENA